MSLTITKLSFRSKGERGNLPLLLRRDEVSLVPAETRPNPESDWTHYPLAYRLDVAKANEVWVDVTFINDGSEPLVTQIRTGDEDTLFDPRALGVLGLIVTDSVEIANGEPVTIPIQAKGVSLAGRGVGVHEVTWKWQYAEQTANGLQWVTLGVSRLTVYTLLSTPGPPWVDTAGFAELPWTTVLDHACRWARCARTVEAAADRISRHLFRLGRIPFPLEGQGGALLRYGSTDNFSNGDLFDSEAEKLHPGAFFCDLFLLRLRGTQDQYRLLNCSDCATIVSTFTNILGGRLEQLRIDRPDTNSDETPPPLRLFTTHQVQMLGDPVDTWRPMEFEFHEVAVLEVDGGPPLVWDACLAFEARGAAFPTRMTREDYLALLTPSTAELRLIHRGRRRLVPEPPRVPEAGELDERFPRTCHAPRNWPAIEVAPMPIAVMISVLRRVLAGRWRLKRWDFDPRSNWPEAVSMTWVSSGEAEEPAWLTAVMYECPTPRAANDLLWQTVHSQPSGPPPLLSERGVCVAYGSPERGYYLAFSRYMFRIAAPRLGRPVTVLLENFLTRTLPRLLARLLDPNAAHLRDGAKQLLALLEATGPLGLGALRLLLKALKARA
ncbi:MAG: LamG domain protein jellyroll fold domain protein [Armatimonadetes bacterium]|jgi:hypothetical protein|nr:LamG domain protein jellyroll fold domain protein [Armatimonadota bacterium]